jgi:tetratricopeptide (TPR) repeat protein
VDNSESSEKIPARNTHSSRHQEKAYVSWNDSPQIPINSPRMSLLRWWRDIRFEQERRIVIASFVIVILALIFVAVLAYSKIESMRKEDEFALSDGSAEALAAEQAKPPPLNGVLEQAAQCVSDSRFEDAVPLLQSAELELVRLQGMVAFKAGDLPKAESLFERALVIDPASIPDLINLADLRLRTGKADLAVALFNRAQAAGPDNTYVANRYLLARIEAGDVAGVRNEIQTALKLSPKNCLPRVGVSAAALELIIGQYVNAANFLYAAQASLPAETFKNLLRETPLSSYATRSELRPFFAPPGAMGPTPGDNKAER